MSSNASADLETLERRHEKYAKVWYLAVAIVLYSLSDNAPLTGRLRLLLPFRLPQDHRLGERDALTSPVAAQLRRLPKNDARAQRVEEVLDRLVSAAGLEHHDLAVEVLESEDCCAKITHTNRLMLTTGLLKDASSDSALAYVLGRELGRVVGQHDRDVVLWPMGIPKVTSLFLMPYLVKLLRRWMHAPARSAPRMMAVSNVFFCAMLLAITLSDIPERGMKDEEVDYTGLLLMAAAEYKTEEIDVFGAATRSCRWRCVKMQENEEPISRTLSRRTLKSDAQRVRELHDLAPLVREMTISHGDSSSLAHGGFDSPGLQDPRAKLWKEFVQQRDALRQP